MERTTKPNDVAVVMPAYDEGEGLGRVPATATATDNFLGHDLDVRSTAHVDWFPNPEIGYLSVVPSRPVGAGDGLLVLSPMQKALEPKEYYGAAAECRRIVYEAGGYTVCWLPSNRR